MAELQEKIEEAKTKGSSPSDNKLAVDPNGQQAEEKTLRRNLRKSNANG